MSLHHYRRAVGVFSNSLGLEAALDDLRNLAFPMGQVSVIGKDVQVASKAQAATKTGAIAGGVVGGVVGLTVGLGTLAVIPGVGPLLFLGVAATALATTLTSGMMGATAGGLLGALIGYGLPKEDAPRYSERLQQGEYLIMIEGSEAEIRQAEAVLSRWHVQQLRVFDRPTLTPLDVQ